MRFDEIIYMDDASTDDSVKRIGKIGSKDNFHRCINDTRLGVAKNSVKGVDPAPYEYVFVMSTDRRYGHNISKTAKFAISKDRSINLVSECVVISRQIKKHTAFP